MIPKTSANVSKANISIQTRLPLSRRLRKRRTEPCDNDGVASRICSISLAVKIRRFNLAV